MPHYDETFIHDDNQNQRKNKRSYRVYKNGLNPLRFLESGDVLHALEEKGTSAIKQNIRNIKHRNGRFKPDSTTLETNSGRPAKDGPDIILDHCPRLRPPNLDVHYKKNCLAPCKSFDNLTVTNSNKNHVKFKLLRNGSSLQNLRHEESLQHYVSPLEDRLGTNRKGGDARNSYSVVDARRRNAQRRLPRATPPPGVGVYRQISNDGSIIKKNENEAYGDSGSGHRGSLRGANKLARRARSFKDDLLERLSNMRSPAQHPPHLSSAIRSHSPLSPKLRTGTKSVTSEEGEVTPAKELERLVKEVTFGLKHFSDVITKRKLEMLPDNGTIVFESIANIHKAIKPYCSRSPQLVGAVKRLCTVLATLIRLCDEITGVNLRSKLAHEGLDESAPALAPAHVASVVEDVTLAVHEVASLAQQHMTRPALAPRPALVSPRASTQRNSLPDIPLTPKERSLLTGEGGAETNGVRASHSSESVLDAPDSPPPKPARPNRKMELAPPLPPKRKSANDNSLIALSIDRLSLQSHSSGSLDSMLNVSNDDSHLSANHDSVFITPTGADIIATCSCGGESRACADPHDGQAHHNHNRFSNESGFVSVGHSEISSEHNFTSSFSAHHYSSHADSRLASITSDESETPPELPVKTRRNVRAELCHQFPAVEIRHPMCSLHNEVRPHTLADNSTRPPPLPLKKKHIMAYMEMFGNCSHPPAAGAVAPPDLFRHSIHTYNLASSQHTSAGAMSIQQHQQVQRSIAQSFTVQHFGTPPLSGSDDSVSITTSSGTSPVPPEPPALPPKMKKNKQNAPLDLSIELVPPASPRPSSHNSVTDEAVFNNLSMGDDSLTGASSPAKFPLEEELKMLAPQPTPSPVPSHKSEGAAEGEPATSESDDIILKTDISAWLLLKAPTKDGPEVRGGHPDALIVLATKATKDFAYQEAFLATYRTWVRPDDLVGRLVRRAHYHRPRPHELRCTLGLLTRIVADLTTTDLEEALMRDIMDFIYWLVEIEELPIAKALRQILVEKQNQVYVQACGRPEYETPCLGPVSLRRDTLLDFKASELAEQMTLLDAALFARISTAEVLSWPRDQSEDSSPNLTRFTEHFNKMSYWARSRILEQDEARRREGLAARLLKVMKRLRKLNNFNSYLALVSALDSPPVRRLGWPRALLDALHDHCAIIDSSSSFRAYRQALADTHPPCIPYIGLVLQDLTFVHIGNPDLLPDGSINFTKRWQQYHIMENMKRFQKEQYKFKRNDRIQAMFNDFNDVLSEETMWQISESIKPRGGRRTAPSAATAPTPAPAQTAA